MKVAFWICGRSLRSHPDCCGFRWQTGQHRSFCPDSTKLKARLLQFLHCSFFHPTAAGQLVMWHGVIQGVSCQGQHTYADVLKLRYSPQLPSLSEAQSRLLSRVCSAASWQHCPEERCDFEVCQPLAPLLLLSRLTASSLHSWLTYTMINLVASDTV